MEFFIWFIVIVVLTLGSVGIVRHPRFQKMLLPKKAAPEVKPVKAKTLFEVHKEDHDFWLAEYKAIFQKTCAHLYHHQAWYTCMQCGYEEPWEYAEGCRCRYAEDRALADRYSRFSLIERASYCTVHGKDFKLFPISDRKSGPYGPRNDQTDSIKKSNELMQGRSRRKVDYDIEGTH